MHKAVCVLLFGSLTLLVPARLWAGIDSAGSLRLDFYADHDQIYQDYESLPDDSQFDAVSADAYLFSNASSFGRGVLIWAGFALVGPQGPRYGMLYLDLDLNQAPRDDNTPMPKSAVKAQYLEKRGDEILFDGTPLLGDVWIVDIVFHTDDRGAIEGDFAFVFVDSAREPQGSRALIRGRFVTDPSPTQLRHDYDVATELGDDYVTVDCSGAVVVDGDEESGCAGDEGGGCGGDDESASGCDGDTSGEAGCEGDTQGSSGCEGGEGSCASDAAGSCAGADGACAQQARAAVNPRHQREASISALSRFFPELSVLAFIYWFRRRSR